MLVSVAVWDDEGKLIVEQPFQVSREGLAKAIAEIILFLDEWF